MAVRSTEELLKALEPLSEGYPDLQISLMEDITDTLKALDATALNERIAELEGQVKAVEDAWREKYRARFMGGEEETENKPDETEEEESEESTEEEVTVADVEEKWKEED